MIGRDDIEGSKCGVAMNAWPPQASYPCGNFSDTYVHKLCAYIGSLGQDFTVSLRTEKLNQADLCPYALHVVSVHIESTFGHLRYLLVDVPPQPNSPSDHVSFTFQRKTYLECARQEKKKRLAKTYFYIHLHSTSLKTTLNLPSFTKCKKMRLQKDKQRNVRSSGISLSTFYGLPPMLHLPCLFTRTDCSQAQQGLLSPLFSPSPFPWLWFR